MDGWVGMDRQMDGWMDLLTVFWSNQKTDSDKTQMTVV